MAEIDAEELERAIVRYEATIAREAQIRVLDRVILQCTVAGSFQEQRLLALKAAIERGEDV